MQADLDAEPTPYDKTRAWLAFLIDHPDKTVTVEQYQSQIKKAREAVAAAHKAMLASHG